MLQGAGVRQIDMPEWWRHWGIMRRMIAWTLGGGVVLGGLYDAVLEFIAGLMFALPDPFGNPPAVSPLDAIVGGFMLALFGAVAGMVIGGLLGSVLGIIDRLLLAGAVYARRWWKPPACAWYMVLGALLVIGAVSELVGIWSLDTSGQTPGVREGLVLCIAIGWTLGGLRFVVPSSLNRLHPA
jgi:hypothetical protein